MPLWEAPGKSLKLPPREATMRRVCNQEECPHPIMWAPWSWTSSLQNRSNFLLFINHLSPWHLLGNLNGLTQRDSWKHWTLWKVRESYNVGCYPVLANMWSNRNSPTGGGRMTTLETGLVAPRNQTQGEPLTQFSQVGTKRTLAQSWETYARKFKATLFVMVFKIAHMPKSRVSKCIVWNGILYRREHKLQMVIWTNLKNTMFNKRNNHEIIHK